MVVDLTIEQQNKPARCRFHWLFAGSRQVNHRQTAMRHHTLGLRINPYAMVIWPTMKQVRAHSKGGCLDL